MEMIWIKLRGSKEVSRIKEKKWGNEYEHMCILIKKKSSVKWRTLSH